MPSMSMFKVNVAPGSPQKVTVLVPPSGNQALVFTTYDFTTAVNGGIYMSTASATKLRLFNVSFCAPIIYLTVKVVAVIY